MNLKDITLGLRVRIAADHPSGHGNRTGRGVAVGTFEGSYTICAALWSISESHCWPSSSRKSGLRGIAEPW